ncbi:MAG: tetratricopeptide repeat protein, partial [Caldilinea sp.]|nr:tetratricopeptide repeat protein [Caldilinea sp.]
TGDFRIERDALVQARACYQTGRLEPYSFESLLGAETHLDWYRGDLTGALEKAQTWLTIAQGSGYSRRRLYATLVLGNVLRALGRYDQSLQVYQAARRIAAESNPNFTRWIDVQESWVAALQGRLDDAAMLAERALAPADHGQRMSFQVNLAVVYLLNGRWPDAEELLRESLDFYRRSQDQVATCAISFHLAYAQLAKKARSSEILDLLQPDLRWLDGCDNAYFPLWWHPVLVSRVALWLLTTTDYRALGRRLFLQRRLGADGLRTLQEAACAGNGALSVEATDLLTILGEPPLHHLDDVEDGSARSIIAAAVVGGQIVASALPDLFRQLRTAQERERDNPTVVAIFLLHTQGAPNQEIATTLSCSTSTVSHSLQSIYESLGVERSSGTRAEQRAALRRAAQARGLLA